MDSTRVRPPRRRIVIPVTLVALAAAIRPVAAVWQPDVGVLDSLVAVAPVPGIALVVVVLVVRADRRQRLIVRALATRRMYGRDDDVLEAAMLAEIRALVVGIGEIRAHGSAMAQEIRANDERWEKRWAEVYQTGYLDGMRRRRGGDDPPTLRSV